jgi:hypothetical protein
MEQARMSADVVWRLDGEEATLQCGPVKGHVQLNRVAPLRLRDLEWCGKSCTSFEVLRCGVPPDARIIERYVRGGDFVVSCSQSAAGDVARDYYWRARFFKEFDAARIELVVSAQTSLLDSRPGSFVRSHAQGVRMFHASHLEAEAYTEHVRSHRFHHTESQTHLVVLRHEPLGVSYAEMIHPSDFEYMQLKFSPDGHSEIRSVLQSEPLEKGVIRRARICGWFMPAENDLATAVELARQFIDEPLPLTV